MELISQVWPSEQIRAIAQPSQSPLTLAVTPDQNRKQEMIVESYYWKKELYKSFLTLARFRHLKREVEQSYVKAEKALMIGAYIIRKLDDAQKIPPELLQKKEKVEHVKSKGTLIDHMNWHRIDSHYDFEQKGEEEKDWRFIINQIIHSFSLFFSYDDGGRLDGFLVNSDKTKKQLILFLPLRLILKVFLSVSEGDITMTSMMRDIVGRESDSLPIFGPMKLKNAVYSYPIGFNLEEVLAATLEGEIYERQEF